jgi:hypothetical protein
VGETIAFGLPQIFELFLMLIQSIPIFVKNSFDFILSQCFFPLHLSSEYQRYSAPLLSCTLALLERKPMNVNPLLMFLLNHWPVRSQKKQVLILSEIENIVKKFWDVIDAGVIRILFRRISLLITSSCVELSENAIIMLQANGFLRLLRNYYLDVTPFILDSGIEVASTHWSNYCASLAISLIQDLSEMDPQNFSKVRIARESRTAEKALRRREMWEFLGTKRIPLRGVSVSIMAESVPEFGIGRRVSMPCTPIGKMKARKRKTSPVSRYGNRR